MTKKLADFDPKFDDLSRATAHVCSSRIDQSFAKGYDREDLSRITEQQLQVCFGSTCSQQSNSNSVTSSDSAEFAAHN